MATQQTYNSIYDIEPTAMLEFFEIFYNVDNLAESYRIHGGTNGIASSIIWQGNSYDAVSMNANKFEIKGDKTLPRPEITISNQSFYISALCRRYNNLNNVKVIRRRVMAKFLDDANFEDGINPFGLADPNAGFPDEIFYISRKVEETRNSVIFELVTPLELENITIPARQINARSCSFPYRGLGCKYQGVPVSDNNGKRFTTADGYNLTLTSKGLWSPDYGTYSAGDYVSRFSNVFTQDDQNVRTLVKDLYVCIQGHDSSTATEPSARDDLWKKDFCLKALSDCKLRYLDELPFGGFPGVNIYNTR